MNSNPPPTSTSLVNGTRSGTMALGSTAAIFYTSPSLALMSLACFPPVFLFASWKGRQMRRQQGRVQDSSAAANAVAQRCLGALRTLRQLGADASMVPSYAAAVGAARDQAVVVGATQAWFDGAVHLAGNAALLGVLGFGAQQVRTVVNGVDRSSGVNARVGRWAN